MNIKTHIFIVAVFMSGCVTIPPEAEKIQIHSQASNLLNDCKKLGPVSGEGSRAISYGHAIATAKVSIRLETSKITGADTVAIINTDDFWNKVVLHGVAYDCY